MNCAYTEGNTIFEGKSPNNRTVVFSIMSRRAAYLSTHGKRENKVVPYEWPWGLTNTGLCVVGFQPTLGQHVVVKMRGER